MTENNQLSDETKNNSTDTSSTDVSSAVIGNHKNAIVPHKISNHDKLVQTMVMVDGEWINVNDTNDQANVKYDMHKVNKKVVEAQKGIVEAKNSAESAVKYADSAVSASKVNSDAIAAQSSAIIEAKSAISSATAAIQQTAATAASDAAKIRADVAQVQNEVNTAKAANSASVEALKSDVSAAKQDLADVHDRLDQAQSAIEQNQKLINDSVAKITSNVSSTKQDLATVHDSLTKVQAAAEQNQKAIDDSIAKINANVDVTNQDLAGVRKDLTKAQSDIAANQKSINDNVAQINADITQDRKDIASAQQANANTAKQLDTYSKQAQEQGRTIKAVQDKQDGFSITLADVQGNVSQVSDKIDGLSASLKDTQGNVASVKAQADQLSATLTDHGKSIATLTASAKELSSTLEDADGRLNKVEQTAQTNSFTLSDVQGNLSQVKQQADGLVSTLKDAQGNISTLQQKADSVSAQLASAQGDIATLQTGVAGVKATLASHDKSIHTLQLDSKTLKDSMADAQGDISTLSKTATSLDSEMKDHAGRLSKVEQSANTQATTLSDLQGNLSQVKQQADGLVTTLKNAQGSITQIQQKADGTLTQLKSAQGDIASLQTDVTGIKATLTSHEGDIHTLQADSKTLKDDMTDAQGNISSLQKSSTKLNSDFSSQDGRLSKVEQTAKEHTSTISDLSDKLSNMKIGGRNLLHGTSDQWRTLTGKAWLYQTTATDMYTSVADYHGGDQFTYSATITNSSTVPVRLVLYCYGADKKPPHLQEVMGPTIGPNAGAVPTQVTITMDANTWFICSDIETLDGKAPSFSIKVKEEKLEKGNVATAWTPNPEDMATLTQVKQTADGIETTLKSAQGDIDQIEQKANGTSEQLADVKGDVTNIQKDVTGLKQTTADNAGNIHTLQSDSKSLHDSMQDAQGDISTLKKTSTDVTSELKDHTGRISKTEQTASTLVNEFADQQGHLNRVEQTATGTQQTVANQQGQINNIKTDVAGIHETITGQGNQIANINVTLSGLNTKYEGVSGDLGKLKSSTMQDRGTVTAPDFNSLTQAGYYTVIMLYNGKNYPTVNWGTLEVSGQTSDSNGRLNQKYVSDNNTETYVRQYNASTRSWTAWVKDANQNDVTALSNRITTNSTQITQNKQAIALKADQSTVDNLSGEVSQNKAQLKVQADQISSKVSSTDFKTLNDKFNDMKIGGRNLVIGTGQDTIIDDTGNTGTQGWRFATINLTQQPKVGDQITVSAEATLTGQGDLSTYDVILYNQAVGSARSNSKRLSSGKRASATLQVNNLDGNGDTVLLIYAGNISDTEGKKNTVHHLKVEFGNLATDWTPAPEDLTTAIQKNSTAIDQTNQQISLKADQTEVDKIKNTASQNSSRLDVMANEIQSKVTSTDVNNIVDSKGYATTSTVQSLITQKAGTINESITNLTNKVNSNNGGGVNLLQGTAKIEFLLYNNGGTQTIEKYDDETNYIQYTSSAPINDMGPWWPWTPEVGQVYTFSADVAGNGYITGDCFHYEGSDSSTLSRVDLTDNWQRISNTFRVNTISSNWVIYANNSTLLKVKHIKIERGSVATPWTPAPSDNATVTQLQSVTASIDGLQSAVKNKVDQSQYTQLAGVVQTKVSQSDFNRLNNQVNVQTLDNANIDNMKTTGHYFVHNLTGNPLGGWVYVDVTGNGNDRIRQDVYQDSGTKHAFRRWFGSYWTGWSTGAEESEITQLRSDINLRVKSGDLLSQINIAAGHTLIQSNKIYFDADSFVMSPNSTAFIPSAYITDINADKITTGTLDAAKFNVKNFSADNIVGGTLNGVVVKTGANDRYFQTSKDNIYWVRNDGMSLVGNDTYLNRANGLNIADMNNIQLTTWGGASVNPDGSIVNTSGDAGHPKIVVDTNGNWDPDDPYGTKWGGGPGNSEIVQWIGNKEYTALTRGKGLTVRLNDENKNSVFVIQKDNKVGFYVGGGDDGGEIRIAGAGPIKLQGKYLDDGFNDGMTHMLGNLQVNNLHVRKWLGVDQSKNAIVKTSQGPVTINAYETAEYYFGDIGEGQTSADGIAYIGIEKLFNETVNTTIPYHVFITAYGPGNIWVDQREHNRFIVKSDQPNLKFSWEIKAKRKGYEQTRLQNVNDKLNHMAATS